MATLPMTRATEGRMAPAHTAERLPTKRSSLSSKRMNLKNLAMLTWSGGG